MVSCPECNQELPDGSTRCHVCGCDLSDSQAAEWIVLGEIDSKLYADFARETLRSYGIPAVVISRDGFFGDIGLPLRPFYNSKAAPFEISVPADYRDEAIEILNMVAGDRWKRKDD